MLTDLTYLDALVALAVSVLAASLLLILVEEVLRR